MLYNNFRLLRRISTVKDCQFSLRGIVFPRQLSGTTGLTMNNEKDPGGAGMEKEKENEDNGQVMKTAKQLKNEAKKQAKMEKFAKKQQKQKEVQIDVI